MRRFQDWLIQKLSCVSKDLSASHVCPLASSIGVIPLGDKIAVPCNLCVPSRSHGQKEFFAAFME